jgi:hypothetical protein
VRESRSGAQKTVSLRGIASKRKAAKEEGELIPNEEAVSACAETVETHEDVAKGDEAMLDVHPAHHAASSWKEFFIHIATIAIGLLLAVGLEQTVEEYVHHRRELTEARRELAEEKRFNIEEFRHTSAEFQNTGDHLKSYLAALRQSIKNPAAPLPVLQVPGSTTSTASTRHGRRPSATAH